MAKFKQIRGANNSDSRVLSNINCKVEQVNRRNISGSFEREFTGVTFDRIRVLLRPVNIAVTCTVQ